MDLQLKKLLMGMVGLMLGSCSLGAPVAPTSDNSVAALTLTSLVQTLTVQAVTASVESPATRSTEGLPTAHELPPTAPPTAAPIVFTPTFTMVPSPSVPMVSVTVGTNCRSGPGREYLILGGAQVGVKFIMVGRNTQTNYWIIRLADGQECWLWGEHAILEGDVASLPEYAIPAPPPPPFGSIQGVVQVKSAFTGTIITFAGIDVTVMPAGITTQTDRNGNYFFNSVPAGEVWITFNFPNLTIDDIPNVIVQGGQLTVIGTTIGSYAGPIG